ncbi:MAG: adenylate/guanylate cyclase domain-containing protein [Candidatus Limnocylindria bacterium]
MTRNLPSGTVTFLFTDVEGSTKLLHALGSEEYAEALAEHRRVLREAFVSHGGVEVDTQGDAFFVAFLTAPGALAAAEQATAALAPGPIGVRIGIHTGTPHLTDEGYVGADVHRAARIAAAGHGGQVLVSAATAALLPTDNLRISRCCKGTLSVPPCSTAHRRSSVNASAGRRAWNSWASRACPSGRGPHLAMSATKPPRRKAAGCRSMTSSASRVATAGPLARVDEPTWSAHPTPSLGSCECGLAPCHWVSRDAHCGLGARGSRGW